MFWIWVCSESHFSLEHCLGTVWSEVIFAWKVWSEEVFLSGMSDQRSFWSGKPDQRSFQPGYSDHSSFWVWTLTWVPNWQIWGWRFEAQTWRWFFIENLYLERIFKKKFRRWWLCWLLRFENAVWKNLLQKKNFAKKWDIEYDGKLVRKSFSIVIRTKM